MEGPSKWLRKGAWAAEEDTLLRQCIDKYGEGKWHQIPLRAGIRSFRLYWYMLCIYIIQLTSYVFIQLKQQVESINVN